MNEPKLHHYVPRFYLNYFLNEEQRLWVYDKYTYRVFRTTPYSIAAETHFNRLPELSIGENDPLYIEKALSKLESRTSNIITRVVSEVASLNLSEKVAISNEERITLSEFIAVQNFRTLEMRELLVYLLEDKNLINKYLSDEEKKAIYFTVLSDSGLLEEFIDSIYTSVWIFGKNETEILFITSDHPICMKSNNIRLWIKGAGPLDKGGYVAFPITPKIVLYCLESSFWSKIQEFDLSISPGVFNNEMVHHENCGQAFMASRFLISCNNNFKEVRDFIPSIGTNLYAPVNSMDTEGIRKTAMFSSWRRKKSK